MVLLRVLLRGLVSLLIFTRTPLTDGQENVEDTGSQHLSADRNGFVEEGEYSSSDLGIPRGWSTDKPANQRRPRSCEPSEEELCSQEYMRCLLYQGPANDRLAACYCARQFYGICLREAGCAATYCTKCVREHMVQDCEDMSVCGSNCVGDGNGLTNFDSTRVLPINNFGKNFLRFSVCDLGVDEDVLERFEVVRMKRCAEPAPGVKGEDAYKICPYWIPPSTFTALLIPLNSTYIRLEYANYVSGEIINGLNDSYYANVLTDPPPKEVSEIVPLAYPRV